MKKYLQFSAFVLSVGVLVGCNSAPPPPPPATAEQEAEMEQEMEESMEAGARMAEDTAPDPSGADPG